MTSTIYNGWTNYETWLFNLHTDDTFTEDAQTAYDDAEADDTFTREENATKALADSIESYAEEFIGEELQNQSGFAADMVNTGLRSINYYEIAKHYIEIADKESEAV